MIRFNHYLSVVIINNNFNNKLLELIDLFTEKIAIVSKIELIIIDYYPEKNEELWHKALKKCQKKQVKLKRINNPKSLNMYSSLKKTIAGDIIIFTQTSYKPEEKWLEKIIQSFSDPHINIVIGKIIDRDSENQENAINNSFTNEIKSYLEIWQTQTANLAMRTDFFQQVKQLNFIENDTVNNIFCGRILRELEDEITYLPNARVTKNL